MDQLFYLFLVWIFSAYTSTPVSVNPKSETVETKTNYTDSIWNETISTLSKIDEENNKSILQSGENITKAFVLLQDKTRTIRLTANIQKDYRIFGYAKPDITSEKLLLLSIFTTDVKNNPFHCKLGAYYETSNMNGLDLTYLETTGDFVKALATEKSKKSTTLYFEKKWIEFIQ